MQEKLSKFRNISVTVLKTALECLRWLIIVLAFGLIVLSLFRIRFYIVTTGSMSPTIPVGSICVVNHNTPFEEVEAGDVISFSVGGNIRVTHRAVRITDEGIITKGDANNTEDNSPVTPENYLGRTILHIPHLGYVMLFLKGRVGRVIVAVVIVLLIGSAFLPKKEKNAASD